jgi:hypothetical protein
MLIVVVVGEMGVLGNILGLKRFVCNVIAVRVYPCANT